MSEPGDSLAAGEEYSIPHKFHSVIRSLYVAHRESEISMKEEFDSRDLACFPQSDVPDVCPLFGGEMYWGLGHVYDEIECTYRFLASVLQAEHAVQQGRSGEERARNGQAIFDYHAFVDCQAYSIVNVSPALLRVVRDIQGNLEHREINAGVWTTIPTWREAFNSLTTKSQRLLGENQKLSEAMRTLYPSWQGAQIQRFVLSFFEIWASQLAIRSEIDEFVQGVFKGTEGLCRALRHLTNLQYELSFLGLSLVSIRPALECLEDT